MKLKQKRTPMKQWFIKKLVGPVVGVDGVIEFGIDQFNESVLAKIEDPEEIAAYATDVWELTNWLGGMFTRHEKWMSEVKRVALKAAIDVVKELAAALKDCKVEKAEIATIVNKVKELLKAYFEAKATDAENRIKILQDLTGGS